jgi:quinol monooxygenase YgiN
MIIFTGSVTTTPDKHERILGLALEHARRARAAPDCLGHNVHIDCENAARLVFLEYWSDLAAMKAHIALPENMDFIDQMRELSPEHVELAIFESHPWPVS